MALAIVMVSLASCTTSGESTTTTTSSTSTTSTTSSPSPSSTTTTTTPVPTAPLIPPDLPDAESIAEDRIATPPGYGEAPTSDVFADDAGFAIGAWLPDPVVAGTARTVLADDMDRTIVVVSVIPTMAWRGDPGLVPALADLDEPGREVSDRIHRTETASGLVIHLWSDGDGFVVATSLDDDAALDYLETLEDERSPQTAWPSGACLYLEPTQGLPWAPFPADVVVPCDGPHNAEVIEARQIVDDFERYVPDEVSYLRNYECDRVYETTMGPQRDRRPTLVTYMPDRAEHERGDRYLACVVQLESVDGPALVAGRITDRDDLRWSPEIGQCFVEGLPPEPTDCAEVHAYEFVGEVEYDRETWPEDFADAFAEACEPVIEALPSGPAPIDVFPMGLYPYAFEHGERSIRCMAFALGDLGLGRVIGSFTGTWRLLGSDGIAA